MSTLVTVFDVIFCFMRVHILLTLMQLLNVLTKRTAKWLCSHFIKLADFM